MPIGAFEVAAGRRRYLSGKERMCVPTPAALIGKHRPEAACRIVIGGVLVEGHHLCDKVSVTFNRLKPISSPRSLLPPLLDDLLRLRRRCWLDDWHGLAVRGWRLAGDIDWTAGLHHCILASMAQTAIQTTRSTDNTWREKKKKSNKQARRRERQQQEARRRR